MENAPDGLLLLLELLDDISLAITTVDDDGQVKLAGEPQMEIEPLLLLGKRCMIPVAVQARFTDGSHPAMGCKLHDPGPVACLGLGHVVGLDADRREDSRVARREVDHLARIRSRGADRDDLNQARGAGTVKNFFEVVLQSVIAEVGVGVNKRPLHRRG